MSELDIISDYEDSLDDLIGRVNKEDALQVYRKFKEFRTILPTNIDNEKVYQIERDFNTIIKGLKGRFAGFWGVEAMGTFYNDEIKRIIGNSSELIVTAKQPHSKLKTEVEKLQEKLSRQEIYIKDMEGELRKKIKIRMNLESKTKNYWNIY